MPAGKQRAKFWHGFDQGFQEVMNASKVSDIANMNLMQATGHTRE